MTLADSNTDGTLTLGLSDFAGGWLIARRIDDAHTGQTGRFAGHAEIDVQGAAATYREAGKLTLGTGVPMRAERVYLWTETAGRIEVRFADGRDFHQFVPGAGAAEAEHLCGEDIYRVRYDFARWPDWQARWTVRGPRKSYVMVSDYFRDAP